MTDKLQLIQEAAKRGILPQHLQPLYDEAVKRGLIAQPNTSQADLFNPEHQARARLMKERPDLYGQGERTWMQGVDDRVRGVAAQAPIVGGFMDEISAGLNTGFGLAGDYDQALALERERDARQWEQNPTESKIGAGVGIVAGTLGAARAVPFKLPKTMPGKITAGTGIGAGGGYVEGFARGENLEDRLEQGEQSAKLGAYLGFGAPIVARGAGYTYGRVKDALAGSRAAQAIGTSPAAAHRVGQALRDDFPDESAALTRSRELGPDAMLANLGPRLEGQASSIASQPVQGKTILNRAVEEQASRGGQRMTRDLDQAFGPADSRFAQRMAYKDAQSPAGALYRAAKGRKVDGGLISQTISDTVDQFPQAGSARKALSQVNDMLVDPRTGHFIDDAGNLVGVRQEIDQIIRTAGEGDYRRGLGTPVGQAMHRVRRAIDETLKQDPTLKRADEIWGTEARNMDALDLGAKRIIGPNGMDPAELAQRTRGMSDTERQALLRGTRGELQRQMGNTAGNRNEALALGNKITSDNNLQRLEIVADRGAADTVRRAAEREQTFAHTGQAISGNSLTASRQAGAQEFPNPTARGNYGELGKRTLAGVMMELPARALDKMLRGAIGRRRANVSNEAASLLAATGGNHERIIHALMSMRSGASQAQKAKITRLAEALLTIPAGRAGYALDAQLGAAH
jgi:hypothetical protein